MDSKLVYYLAFFNLISFFVSTSSSSSACVGLNPDFYAKSCPNLETIVTQTMKQALRKEPRMGASLLRLHFHDCFVNGCDGSVLLVDTPSFQGEQTAGPNANNSIRGFGVIDAIKANVEAECRGVVSCADILALAARDGTTLLGGPTWRVPLGRRDARTANKTLANQNLPPPTSSLAQLKKLFGDQGLSIQEMTALSGGHSIGFARCSSFKERLYKNSEIIDPSFAATRRANCPRNNGTQADFNLAPLDLQTPYKFDNDYYQNIVSKRGLLHSDQVLYSGGSQDSLTLTYSTNQDVFFKDFAAAMISMGNIKPLTGNQGEIRKRCGFVN